MAAPSLPTPLYGHVGRGAFSDVYEPSEDTFLLLDALEAAAAELAGCTDINPQAAACTLETAHCNRVHLQPIITDLVQGLLPRLKGKVDLLVFNPPYVVTPPEEVLDEMLVKASGPRLMSSEPMSELCGSAHKVLAWSMQR
ncbi:HemK methyltransferase family member 2 [Microtus ochrogaster]|uniref:HemK methyltransferase family member 2 n=1 Tax=Microtus ochrogaster TaxID=79684 RepID=A0A8J6G4S9_MICOH|nr:HemK methyltransferase family member 2 [Microtus ochrogaster]